MLVGIDPGKHTGIAVYPDKVTDALKFDLFVELLWDITWSFVHDERAGKLQFVVESFKPYLTFNNPDAIPPIEVIGYVKGLAQRYEVPVHFQDPFVKKMGVPQALEWGTLCSQHEKDAAKHIDVFLFLNPENK